jgi:hypothetical protein
MSIIDLASWFGSRGRLGGITIPYYVRPLVDVGRDRFEDALLIPRRIRPKCGKITRQNHQSGQLLVLWKKGNVPVNRVFGRRYPVRVGPLDDSAQNGNALVDRVSGHRINMRRASPVFQPGTPPQSN